MRTRRHVTFGKYHVLARLGRGGMGEVFLVVDMGPAGVSKLVVVKELREELASTPEARSMFLDEARLAARLNHPNVVQTFGVVEDGESLYLTMEFLDGQPLERILRGGKRDRFSRGALLRVLVDALAGLHYAHELTDYDGKALAVVHRDVTPHNVIVTYDGTVKLVDFGIAKAATGRTTTESGVFKGKLRFSSPEQAMCSPVDRRVDVFAVGAILWEILAGRDMWHGLPDATVMLEVAAGRIPSLRDARPDVDPELAAICHKALAPEPDARFATANEFRSALVEYIARRGEPVADLGATLAQVFAEERLEMRTAIDAELKKVGDGPPKGSAERQVPELTWRPPPPRAEAARTTIPVHSTKPAPRLPAARVRRARVAGAVALGALLASAALALALRGDGRPARAAGILSPARAVAEAPAPPSPIHLRVTARPPTAALSVDGANVGANPYDAAVTRDDAVHHVTASAAGFETRTLDVRFDHDIQVDVALAVAAPVAKDAPAASGHQAPPRMLAPSAPKRGTVGTLPQPAPARAIEEEDPFK